MRNFREFIAEMELISLPTLGSKSNWFNASRNSLSKQNCFSISKKFD